MYFEAVFCFYILFNQLIGNSLFRLICFGSVRDIIEWHFALTLTKLHFYVNYVVGFLWESSTTVSTCFVLGKRSTGWITSAA